MSYTYYKRGFYYFRVKDNGMEFYNFDEGAWHYRATSPTYFSSSLGTPLTEEEFNTVLMLRELKR